KLSRGVFKESPIYQPRNFTLDSYSYYKDAAASILDIHLKEWLEQLLDGRICFDPQEKKRFFNIAPNEDLHNQNAYTGISLEDKGSEPDPVEARSHLNPVRDQEDVGAGDRSASMLLGESGKHPSSAEEQMARARELYEAGELKEARNCFK